MKFHTISSIVGTEVKSIKGKMSTIPKVEGIISSKELCEEFRDKHLKLGHRVSSMKKWKRSSKTHSKSRSGKGRKTKEG